jgi:hypothetical protein
MKTIMNPTNGILRTLGVLCGVLLLSGCSALDTDIEDCSATYQVRFRYDMNMKYADAFEHEVRAVTLYVIAPDGTIVAQEQADADQLDATDGTITLHGVAPGSYSLLAWCSTNQKDSYTFGAGSEVTDLTCTVNGQISADGDPYINHELDDLYHGQLQDITLPDSAGTYIYTVPLTKDTNRFRIVLQHIASQELSQDDFSFNLTDANEAMAYDNSVISTQPMVYEPWTISSALNNSSALSPADDSDEAINGNAVIAELTTARLVADHSPRLRVVNNANDSTVIDIPIIDYMRLVMGYENNGMALQEYLDRQDEYNLVFFIDERGNWLHTYVYINSWKVILQDKAL